MSGLTRVEVRHGKAKHAFDLPSDDADATVGWLMDLVEAASGVMRKHQKLICKGAVLESGRSLASQCAHRDGKATVMLVASAGGGGGAAKKPPTAGEAALITTRGGPADLWPASFPADWPCPTPPSSAVSRRLACNSLAPRRVRVRSAPVALLIACPPTT